MKKQTFILLCGVMVAGSALAGGSIFGGGKKTRNADGVSSVGIQICGSLRCPDVIIKEGDCGNIENATQQYGVCVCKEEYHVVDGKCLGPCEENPIDHCTACSPKSGNSICEKCEEGYYLQENECIQCPPPPPPCLNAGLAYNIISIEGCPLPKITYCSDEKPICNEVSGQCEPCPSDKPVWTGLKCEACPADNPVWDSTQKMCVECLENSDCEEGYVCSNKQCLARECDPEKYPRTTKPVNCTTYEECISPTEHRYTLCQKCNEGTVWDRTNQWCTTYETKCPPGYYCLEDGCPSGLGYWCPGGADPIPCPPGNYCEEGSYEPTPCPAGSYCTGGSGGTGGGSWGDIGGGFGFGGGGFWGVNPCPTGYYCSGGTAPAEPCPKGYYCPEDNPVEPIPCPEDAYCPTYTCVPLRCGESTNWKIGDDGFYLECVHGNYIVPEGKDCGSCICLEGWTGELCDIEKCDTTEYPLLEKDLDTDAYTYEICEDTEKHYKKTGCTITHMDEDESDAELICIHKCDAKINEHDEVCETCTIDEQSGDVTIALANTTCSNPDGIEGNTDFICANNSDNRGECQHPCTLGSYADFMATTCLPAQHAENGKCVADYADAGTSCENPLYPGEGSICDGFGNCGCPDGKMYSPLLAQCVTPTGTGCKSNSDCDVGSFCEVTSYRGSQPDNTQCKTFDYFPNEEFEIQTVNGRKRVIHTTDSSQATNFKYDTGLNWCMAQGGRLASLTDFGITHCTSSGGSLNKCGRTDLYVQKSDGTYTPWTTYYKTLTADDKYNWDKLTTYNWMSEPFDSSRIYEFNPSNGAISAHTYDHSCGTLYHILCILDDGISCPTNSSYRTKAPSSTSKSQETSTRNCYCNADTPYWDGSKCVACPTGTSPSGQGGSVAPTQCKCDIANTVWNSSTNQCECIDSFSWNSDQTACINKCENYIPTACMPTCNPSTGKGIPLASGTKCIGDLGTCNTAGLCESDEAIIYQFQDNIFFRSKYKMCGGSTAESWCTNHGGTIVSLADTGITGGYDGCQCINDSCIGADWPKLQGAFPDLVDSKLSSAERWWTSDQCAVGQSLYIILEDHSVHYHNHNVCDYYSMCKLVN